MLHPLHTFCFAELHTPDVEQAAQFYGDLFGWTAVPVGGVLAPFSSSCIHNARTCGPEVKA